MNPEFDHRNPAEMRVLCEGAARLGGSLAIAAFGRPIAHELKPDGSEVSEADLAAERAIVDYIRARRPGDLFIGEESVAGPNSAAGSSDDVYWIIDPIDGTRNFVRGVPCFACTVAVMHAGRVLAGAIFDPSAGRMYSAAASGGAWLDGRPLPRLDTPDAAALQRGRKPLVAIPSLRRAIDERLTRFALQTAVIRSLGTATLHLAYVATGQFDATILNNCKLWDIAAGALLIEQVGGSVADLAGRAIFPLDLPGYRGEELPTVAAQPVEFARLLAGAA